MTTKIETLIYEVLCDTDWPDDWAKDGMTPEYFEAKRIAAALRQADQQAQTLRAAVIEECRQKIIDLRLPDCEWEKKYNDRFDDGVRAAIHQLNALLKPAEEIERYDCPIHGLQDGPDCARC